MRTSSTTHVWWRIRWVLWCIFWTMLWRSMSRLMLFVRWWFLVNRRWWWIRRGVVLLDRWLYCSSGYCWVYVAWWIVRATMTIVSGTKTRRISGWIELTSLFSTHTLASNWWIVWGCRRNSMCTRTVWWWIIYFDTCLTMSSLLLVLHVNLIGWAVVWWWPNWTRVSHLHWTLSTRRIHIRRIDLIDRRCIGLIYRRLSFDTATVLRWLRTSISRASISWRSICRRWCISIRRSICRWSIHVKSRRKSCFINWLGTMRSTILWCFPSSMQVWSSFYKWSQSTTHLLSFFIHDWCSHLFILLEYIILIRLFRLLINHNLI